MTDRDSVLFSIVIPTHNRPGPLRRCLQVLEALQYPKAGFEVVVVDDGSSVPIDRVVRPFEKSLNISCVRTARGGPAAARNVGADVASGRYLAFTDDDCLPAPDWLQRLKSCFEQRPDCLIGGRVVNLLERNLCAGASQIILDAAYAYYNRNACSASFLASCNMAVASDLFRSAGGFRVELRVASEDRELCNRWLHLGYRLLYCEDAVIFHAHCLTLPGFCRQHFNYGRGAYRFHQICAKRGSGRFLDHVGFYARLLDLLRGPVTERPPASALKVTMLLLLWQICNAAGFVFEGLGRCSLSRVHVP